MSHQDLKLYMNIKLLILQPYTENTHTHTHTTKYTCTQNLCIKQKGSPSGGGWVGVGQEEFRLVSNKNCHQLRDMSVSLYCLLCM